MAVAREFADEGVSFVAASPGAALLDAVEGLRRAIGVARDEAKQTDLGQYFTPAPIARFMARLFPPRAGADHLHVLDPGAGIGVLSAAWVEAVCGWPVPPSSITVTAYEVDDALIPHLHRVMSLCAAACAQVGVAFSADVRARDFISDAVQSLAGGLFASRLEQYDAVIMNPPYFKIHSDSPERWSLRRAGIETSNIYTGFLALTLQLLADGVDLVAITPRSYCNGRYFRPFRSALLSAAALKRFHLFARRDKAFADDAVLQETVIAHVTVGAPQPETVTISESVGLDLEHMSRHEVPFTRVVYPDDPERILHLAANSAAHVADRMDAYHTPLSALGLSVSTGRVVDFRARPWLRAEPGAGTVPLIYPEHCVAGGISWPKGRSKKAQAIIDGAQTADLLVPTGVYVLVKRFSAKEERRRVVAVVYDPERHGLPGARVGFENHLNYYHCGGKPLPRPLARGLAAFLNSTLVDEHFRSWSGSTQVNATDLRKLRYPSAETLCAWGARLGEGMPGQGELDRLVDGEGPG
jgi:adenine-specific DNA-methyltransferase